MANQKRPPRAIEVDPDRVEDLAGPPKVPGTPPPPRSHDSAEVRNDVTIGISNAATDSAGTSDALGGASGPRPLTEERARPMGATPTHEEGSPVNNELLSPLDTDKLEPGAGLGDHRALRGSERRVES